MEAKRELLVGLVAELPLSEYTCYFCMINKKSNGLVNCTICEYGKVHGPCVGGEKDTWGKIQIAKRAFKAALSHYYTGETYTDEAKLQRHAEFLKLKAEFETD